MDVKDEFEDQNRMGVSSMLIHDLVRGIKVRDLSQKLDLDKSEFETMIVRLLSLLTGKLSGLHLPDGHFVQIPHEAEKRQRPSRRRTPL